MKKFFFVILLSFTLEAKLKIYVSQDSSIYEEALTGIEAVIQESAEVFYLDTLEEQYGDLESYFKNIPINSQEIIIALGFKASHFLEKFKGEGILIFSMVSSPKSLDLKRGNICGVSMDLPVTEFFSLMKEINPKYRRVIAFYSPVGEAQAMEGAYLDLPQKVLYEAIRVDDPKDFSQVLMEKGKDSEAILMLSDPLYTEQNFEILSRFARENSKVLMTSFRSLVDLGATFALTPDYNRIGVLTGELYLKVKANPKSCDEELVILPDEYSLYINEAYAKAQGIEFPKALIKRARNTRLFQAAVALFRQDKLTLAKKIFEMILEEDPQNKPALFYLELIVERQTGNRTRQLLAEAKEYMAQKKYALAKIKYQEVLKLNPKNQEAREGIKEANFAHSEEYRLEAQDKVRQGKNFDAIRAYLESLKILPTNQKAKLELMQIRQLEAKKISQYLEEANKAYNARNYEKAMEVYDNILLIDPDHKEAGEYLRLSKQKYEAAERLLRKQKFGGS